MKRLVLILVLLSLVGCNSDVSKVSGVASTSTLDDKAIVSDVGRAYFSAHGQMSDVRCINGRIVETPHVKNIKVSIGGDLTAEDIRNGLDGQLRAAAQIGPLELGVNGHVSHEMAASERVSNQFVHISLKGPSLRFATDSYAPTEFFQLNNRLGDMTALGPCGDAFVASVEYGADISVGLKLEFLSEEQKEDIGGDIFFRQGIPIIDLGLSVEAGANVYEKRINDSVLIKVYARQTGGEPLKLIEALPSSIVQCSLNHLDPCIEFVEAIMTYANSDFVTQFNELDDYVVKSMTTIAYNELPLQPVSSDLGSVLDARRLEILMANIQDELDQTNLEIRRTYSLMNHYNAWLSAEQLAQIKALNLSLLENRSHLLAILGYCRKLDEAASCQDKFDTVNDDLLIVAPDILGINLLEAFPEEQCKNAITVGIEQGVINSNQAEAFMAMMWSPIYVDNEEPALGIKYWSYCSIAVETYGQVFRRLMKD